MLYTLSCRSYDLYDCVLGGEVIGIYSSHENAQQAMIANVKETALINDANKPEKGVMNIDDDSACYESCQGYFIEYKINIFSTIQ